jgi:hypothetical protein
MSLEGMLFAVVAFLVVVAVAALPLARERGQPAGEDSVLQKQRDRLLLYYERVLTNLRDLEEDHRTGKLNDADYEIEREEWAQRGVQVLKTLDELDQHHLIAPDADQEAIDRAIDSAIEQAVATHRRERA